MSKPTLFLPALNLLTLLAVSVRFLTLFSIYLFSGLKRECDLSYVSTSESQSGRGSRDQNDASMTMRARFFS